MINLDGLEVAAKKIFDDGCEGFHAAAESVGYEVAGKLLHLFLSDKASLLAVGQGGFPNPKGVEELVSRYSRIYRS